MTSLFLALSQPDSSFKARPLDRLTLAGVPDGARLEVFDGAGRLYCGTQTTHAEPTPFSFVVGGTTGTQRVDARDADGALLGDLHFEVEAHTELDDGGEFGELFRLALQAMRCYSPTGEGFSELGGERFGHFVPWILDHFHTAKGMRYFSDKTGGLVELLARTQREDGMIWSFAFDISPDYFGTRDLLPDGSGKRRGDTRRLEGLTLARQPAENHCEACFVETLFLAWQTSGDDEWMKRHLDAARRALDYVRHSELRWSDKYNLLKRGYTIDSWDFQVEDAYSVPFPISSGMSIDERTKFGVFFGDNTGYAFACEHLSQMLEVAGRREDATTYRERAADVGKRLDALSWNGRFFRHRVEEDSSVVRDLGVDESVQISLSNAYSLNRHVKDEQVAAIVNAYRELSEELPSGSPGEWYAIYPPFERGFGEHDKWQYMNGGVHGHVAGELARGALQGGFASYGADVLRRLLSLAKRTDGQLHFAYTGAFPDEGREPVRFTPLDIAAHVNMGLRGGDENSWMGETKSNDLASLPSGAQELAGVPFQIPQGAVALRRSGKQTVEVEVNASVGAVYLLHTAGNIGASGVMGAVTWVFEDGEEHAVYLRSGQHGSGWWFPELSDEARKSQQSALAWQGSNAFCTRVGVCWVALPNPRPDIPLRALRFDAALDGATYALLGLTLASRVPVAPVSAISTGGPDNWTGGTVMAALLEGLAGIADEETALRRVHLAPRWEFAGTPEARVCACYGGSNAYIAYRYRHEPDKRRISLQLTGSGEEVRVELPLPSEARGTVSVRVNDGEVEFVRLEGAVELRVALPGPLQIEVSYE